MHIGNLYEHRLNLNVAREYNYHRPMSLLMLIYFTSFVIWNEGIRIPICLFNFPSTVYFVGTCCQITNYKIEAVRALRKTEGTRWFKYDRD